MSRSERLLDLLQVLRRHRRPVSGQALAQEVGVSIRTLYRDIATLQAQGADIEGEPGLGYILKPGFMLPPLMFSVSSEVSLVLVLSLTEFTPVATRLSVSNSLEVELIVSILRFWNEFELP